MNDGYVCVLMCAHVDAEGQLAGVCYLLSFYQGGSRDLTAVVVIGDKCLCLLSHLTDSSLPLPSLPPSFSPPSSFVVELDASLCDLGGHKPFVM